MTQQYMPGPKQDQHNIRQQLGHYVGLVYYTSFLYNGNKVISYMCGIKRDFFFLYV